MFASPPLLSKQSAGAYVWSSVAVSWEAPLYLQYGEGRPPFADVVLPSLSTSQPYDISLDLVVPATDTNYNLGNFMTTLTLATPSNRTLATIRRPAIVLPPKSVIAFLLSSPTTTALHLSLLQSYTFGTSSVIAKVELGRRDEWRTIGKGEGRELSVLSASVVGTVRHKGIRGLVSRYPLLSAVVASSTFLVIGLAFLFTQIFFLPAVQWKAGGDFEVPDSGVMPPAAEVKQEGGTERRLRKRSSLKGTRTSRGSRDSLGEEIAAGFVKNGAKVYISSRSAKDCQSTADELNALGPGSCVPLPADMQKVSEVERLVDELSKREQALHVLVNNAGTTWGASIDDHPDEAFSKVLTLNLQRVFTLTQRCLPLLRAAAAQGGQDAGHYKDPARIINIGSVEGNTVPDHETYAYSSSKAGLHQLSRHLAGRLGPEGITSNTIACGPFETKMMGFILNALRDVVLERVPLSRIGTPEDVAGTAIYLASRAGAFVTGATITLDGGLVVRMPSISKL
ncbi:hypothetical protein EWM64_g6377 [Hericium alpestre]|uniref:Uncharacterized protein n=1 Tax=Hericium alpestre TaxID=135208 RepID=A0A4Y9ZRZ5_9AGAM|nr:hypothetical protein EWM64_g6377 [Hericium alpestre]